MQQQGLVTQSTNEPNGRILSKNNINASKNNRETFSIALSGKVSLGSVIVGGLVLFTLTAVVYYQEAIDETPMKKSFSQSVSQHYDHSELPSFVFILGLEGAGHHMMGDILQASPSVVEIYQLGLDRNLRRIRNAFFGDEGSMVAPCTFKKRVNITASHMTAAEEMKAMVVALVETRTKTTTTNPSLDDFYIPINAMGAGKMLSYPTGYACHRMQYPSLDEYYQTCQDANVQCTHLYLYRDPYAIVASTTRKRSFNPSTLAAMHLYTSHLHILYAQLSRYSSGTMGCLSLLTVDDDGDSTIETHDIIANLFGWKHDRASFEAHLVNISHPPFPMTAEEKKQLIPPNQALYMQYFQQTHQDVIDLCRKQVQERRRSNVNVQYKKDESERDEAS
jgi:hypothetical protein